MIKKLPPLYAKNDEIIMRWVTEGRYKADTKGNVYSRRSAQGHLLPEGQWRKLNLTPVKGYRAINGRGFKVSAHRFIFYYFYRRLNPFKQINHIDGNPSNNAIENLELVTPSQNLKHSFRFLGRKPTRRLRFTPEEAALIRRLKAEGQSYRALQEQFSASRGTLISLIKNRHYL